MAMETRMQFWRHTMVLLSLVPLVSSAVACGTQRPASLDDQTLPSTLTTQGAGVCGQEGEVRVCKRLISRHDNVVTCAVGTQSCSEGMWSECGGPTQSIATFQRGRLNASLPPQLLATGRPSAGVIPPPEVLRVMGAPSRASGPSGAPTATGSRSSQEVQ